MSTHPESRVKAQGYTEYEILEEHQDIYEVSTREIELQLQFFGKRDTFTPYWQSYQMMMKRVENSNKPESRRQEKAAIAVRLHLANRTTIEIQKHNQMVSDTMMAKGTHPSQQIKVCPKCGRQIKGCGPLARHTKLC